VTSSGSKTGGIGVPRNALTTPYLRRQDPGKKSGGKKAEGVPFEESAASIRGKGLQAYTLRNFQRFCGYLPTENREPLKIEPFQRRILRDHFAGVIEEVVVLPKKNGKTTIFSALALFHLLVIREAEVLIDASSRDPGNDSDQPGVADSRHHPRRTTYLATIA
jgi:hypothetical protein